MLLPPLVKTAVGDAQTFESSLASIGRSVLAAKCPTLFKHEIGFQVLDSDEDNTRAVGVYGFRIGNRILYAPVFYRDGRLKGTGQLRDPKRDRTVPLTDNWVNKILTERGDEPPRLTARSSTRASSHPSLWQIKYPPSKFAADADWAAGAAAAIAPAIGRRPTLPRPDVDLIKTASSDPRAFAVLCAWMNAYPAFNDAVLRFHGAEKVAAAARRVQTMPIPEIPAARLTAIPAAKQAKARPPKRAGVTVVRVRSFSMSSPPPFGIDFSPRDMDDLKAGRNVYDDKRKAGDTSKIVTWVHGTDGSGTTLSNPGAVGVYRVIEADGDESPCLVAWPLVGWDHRPNRCLVVRLADGAYKMTHTNAVWCRGEADPHQYAQWVDSLPDVGKTLPEGDEMIALTPDKYRTIATTPFQVTDAATGAAYACHGYAPAPYWNRDVGRMNATNITPRYREETAPRRVRVWGRPGRPFVSGGCLYVPNDAKVVKLSAAARLELAEGMDPEHLVMAAVEKTAAAADAKYLTVGTGGPGFYVDDPRTKGRAWYGEAPDCEEALVVGHHLKVADARAVVDRAAAAGKVVVAVKYADQGLSHDWPNAPATDDPVSETPDGFADDVVPSQTPTQIIQHIQDLSQQPNTADRYRPWPTAHGVEGNLDGVGNGTGSGGGGAGPTPDDLKVVARAGETGRRELFDTAALAALIKHTRLPRLLEEVGPRLLKAVSDLGDMMAHLAWNIDEWSEQFGESEVGAIEDQVGDLFDGLGDLYLTLQEKQVADPREYGILPTAYQGDGSDAKS